MRKSWFWFQFPKDAENELKLSNEEEKQAIIEITTEEKQEENRNE